MAGLINMYVALLAQSKKLQHVSPSPSSSLHVTGGGGTGGGCTPRPFPLQVSGGAAEIEDNRDYWLFVLT